MKLNIYITGISGFIGSSLAIELIKKGHRVYGGDKESPIRKIESLEIERIDYASANKESFINKLRSDNIHLVYHLASPIGVDLIKDDPQKTLREANKINTLIDIACERLSIPCVYSSSSEVFGSGSIDDNTPLKIKRFKDSPRWSYAAAKIHGEALFTYCDYPSTIIRFFNVVGANQTTSGMVMVEFFKNAIANKPLIIKENGLRSYCDIDEAIQHTVKIGLDLAINKEDSLFYKNDYNIGNADNSIYVCNLANKIIKLTNSNSVIEKAINTKSEIPERILLYKPISDIPSISIDEILKKIYNSKTSTSINKRKYINIIGYGIVGKSLTENLSCTLHTRIFDDTFSATFSEKSEMLETDSVTFICVDTPNINNKQYTKNINNIFRILDLKKTKSLIVIKSTILYENILYLNTKYPNLDIVYYPEFLNAKTATIDFHNQKYHVIGSSNDKSYNELKHFIKNNFIFKDPSLLKFEKVSIKEAVHYKYTRNLKNIFNLMFWETIEDLTGSSDKLSSLLLNDPCPENSNINQDGYRGYGQSNKSKTGYSACLPKDLEAINAINDHPLLKSISKYNSDILYNK